MKAYKLAIPLLAGISLIVSGCSEVPVRPVQNQSKLAKSDTSEPYERPKLDETQREVVVREYVVRKGDGVLTILRDELKRSKYFSFNTNDDGRAVVSMHANKTYAFGGDVYDFFACSLFEELNSEFVTGECPNIKIGQKISVPDFDGDGKIKGKSGKAVKRVRFNGTMYEGFQIDRKLIHFKKSVEYLALK